MKKCDCCPEVPIVSHRLALATAARIPPAEAGRVQTLVMGWLTQRHLGLSLYAGVTGRNYTDEEKAAIAVEFAGVAHLPCPFYSEREPGGCVIGGLGEHYNGMEEGGRAPYGWLPTYLARVFARTQLRELASRGYIADGKIGTLTTNERDALDLHAAAIAQRGTAERLREEEVASV